MSIKCITIRIDERLLHKLHVVSAYEARSASAQVRILIQRCIAQFEQEHGCIMENIEKPPRFR